MYIDVVTIPIIVFCTQNMCIVLSALYKFTKNRHKYNYNEIAGLRFIIIINHVYIS